MPSFSLKKLTATNNILTLTLLAMVVISIVISFSFYSAQLKIFQEKELHKLECIANAVSWKINGEEHQYLFNHYTSRDEIDSLIHEPAYQSIQKQLIMAKNMNGLEEDMYTMIYDSTDHNFLLGISSGQYPLWLETFSKFPDELREIYKEGGGKITGPYESENGHWLSAQAPILDSHGKFVGVLQVDERLDNFMASARYDIFTNLTIMMVFIFIVAILMYMSVKTILKRQEKLNFERMEIDSMRKELIANVSHDLRTPLASIQGYVETLLIKKDDLDPERFEKYLKTTLRSTEKLRRLVDELFELSKLEAKERKLLAEPMSIADLIHDTINNLKMDASRKDVKLFAEIPKNMPQVIADIALIDRVLQNLISNSIKFCSKEDSICVRALPDDDCVNISVIDTGVGIASKDLPHVFDRFHKGNTPKSGTGLGLAIVKNILELHHSKYQIESKEEKGTTFTFSVPLYKPEVDPVN